MAINIDLSKPLSKKDVEHLRTRMSNEAVDRLVQIAGESDAAEPKAPADPPKDGEFDPGTADVDGVNEYLMTASPEETERVLAAERAGKARKGILEA